MMRGTKETLGGMKEGTKSKSRTAGPVTVGKAVKPAGKTSGRVESEHGSVAGSRKTSIRKGGTHK